MLPLDKEKMQKEQVRLPSALLYMMINLRRKGGRKELYRAMICSEEIVMLYYTRHWKRHVNATQN